MKYVISTLLLVLAVWFYSPAYRVVYDLELNHKYPVWSKGYEYKSLTERAYVVDDHIVMTQSVIKGHFPDDGTIGDNKAYFYWVDFPLGVKAFLTEKSLLPFHLRLLPTWLRLRLYPKWIRDRYPLIAMELRKDGGWKDRVTEFKKDEEKIENQWRRWRDE